MMFFIELLWRVYAKWRPWQNINMCPS